MLGTATHGWVQKLKKKIATQALVEVFFLDPVKMQEVQKANIPRCIRDLLRAFRNDSEDDIYNGDETASQDPSLRSKDSLLCNADAVLPRNRFGVLASLR